MIPQPPRYTRTYTLFPYPPLFRSFSASEPLGSEPLVLGGAERRPLRRGCAGPRHLLAAHPAAVTDEAQREAVSQPGAERRPGQGRSEEHTSELQSLMRISYAVFCLKKKKRINKNYYIHRHKT